MMLEEAVLAIVVSLGSLEETPSNRPATVGRVALSLNGATVKLHHELPGGKWVDVGQASLEDRDFAKQIEWLRVEALARTGRQQPVMIWLPDDQVLERNFPISGGSRTSRRNLAADLFERETAYLRDELEIAVGPSDENRIASCLAILRQTRLEAEEHLASWGFEPGPVTIPALYRGGDHFPEFERCEQRGRRAMRIGAKWGAIGIGVIGTGSIAAAAIWGFTLFMKNPSPVPAKATAAIAFPMIIERQDEAARFATAADPKIEAAKLVPAPRLHNPGSAQSSPETLKRQDKGWLAEFVPPVTLAEPRIVTASERFNLGRVKATEGLPLQLASLNGSTGELISTTEQNPGGSFGMLRQNDTEGYKGKSGLATIPYDRVQEPVLASIAAVADAPLTAPIPFPRRSLERSSASRKPAVPQVADPGASALKPVPRPNVAGAPTKIAGLPEAETDQVPDAPTAVSHPAEPVELIINMPHPKPVIANINEPVGSNSVTLIEPMPSGEATTENVPAGVAQELLVAMAIPQSPIPQPRPERRSRKVATTRELVPRSAASNGPVSRTVGKAASHSGIPLDRTSLVGIINMSSGREALLRLPSGGFRRVGRGDEVEGWQVSMIGRDALQLSQGRKRRTLLLVDR